MKFVVDIPVTDEGTEAIVRRVLGDPGKTVKVEGFAATVLGEVKGEFEALVPYIIVEGA